MDYLFPRCVPPMTFSGGSQLDNNCFSGSLQRTVERYLYFLFCVHCLILCMIVQLFVVNKYYYYYYYCLAPNVKTIFAYFFLPKPAWSNPSQFATDMQLYNHECICSQCYMRLDRRLCLIHESLLVVILPRSFPAHKSQTTFQFNALHMS